MRALAIAITALALAACGKEDRPTGESRTAAPPVATATTPAEAGGVGKIPDVVGLRLPVAIDRLDAVGQAYQARTDRRAVTGGNNWEVCEVKPSPGVSVPRVARIEIVVARPGRCRELIPDVARPKKKCR